MSLEPKSMNIFERHLTLWVGLCILAGIGLGKLAPDLARTLDGMSLLVNGAPVVSIPIAICLFFMMYPIMVKIDFGAALATVVGVLIEVPLMLFLVRVCQRTRGWFRSESAHVL